MTERSSNKTMMVLPATPPEKANSKTVMVFLAGNSVAVATEAAAESVALLVIDNWRNIEKITF
jgi:predicted transcriptional regulator